MCERTIRSACAQSCPDFRVIVVCNEVPRIEFEHRNLELESIETCQIPDSHRLKVLDKGKKLFVGFQKASAYEPSHIMMLDADDCVSNRLAGLVAQNSNSNGWYFKQGYFHNQHQTLIHVEKHNFYQWCGSSCILRAENLALSGTEIEETRVRHRFIVDQMAAQGTPLQPLPFAGAVYNLSHGENFNDYAPIIWPKKRLRRIYRRVRHHRKLTPEIRSEFGLYDITC